MDHMLFIYCRGLGCVPEKTPSQLHDSPPCLVLFILSMEEDLQKSWQCSSLMPLFFSNKSRRRLLNHASMRTWYEYKKIRHWPIITGSHFICSNRSWKEMAWSIFLNLQEQVARQSLHLPLSRRWCCWGDRWGGYYKIPTWIKRHYSWVKKDQTDDVGPLPKSFLAHSPCGCYGRAHSCTRNKHQHCVTNHWSAMKDFWDHELLALCVCTQLLCSLYPYWD